MWLSLSGRRTAAVPYRSYRPVTVLTYRLGYLIHGVTLLAQAYHESLRLLQAEPRLFRWVSIWLHALACNLGMLLVDPMLGRQVDTLLFGLMFAVHPIHVDSLSPPLSPPHPPSVQCLTKCTVCRNEVQAAPH